MPALPSSAVARGRARRERRALRTAGCGSAATRRRPNRRRFASGEAGLRVTDARPRPHATRGKSRHGRDSWLGQRRCRTLTHRQGSSDAHAHARSKPERGVRTRAGLAMGSSCGWRGLTAVRRWCAAAWSGRSENPTGRDMAARGHCAERGGCLGNVGPAPLRRRNPSVGFIRPCELVLVARPPASRAGLAARDQA
jgi:hypothetical protein